MQEIRSLEDRINLRMDRFEKSIEETFDHFAMMMQKQFSELINITREIKVDVAELKVDVNELKNDTSELKIAYLNHDRAIAEIKADTEVLKALSVRQESTL